METNSNEIDSLKKLNSLVAYLSPTLNSYGFRCEAGQSGNGHGEFANCFFVHEKIKIGLIYRQSRLGCNLGSVNYEGTERNLSHDNIIKALGKVGEQKLFYNANQFYSYTSLDEGVHKALLLDLENVIIPYIEITSAQDINQMMNNQPKWWEK